MARVRQLAASTGWLSCVLALAACERAQVEAADQRAQVERTPAPGLAGATPTHDEPLAPTNDEPLALLVGAATRLAAGDLDGDGAPELVLVDAASLRVVDPSGRERARQSAPGGIQVLHVADIDHDGRAEILTGWGTSREHRDAHARASVLRLDGESLREDIVVEPTTERAQIVELLPLAEHLPLAASGAGGSAETNQPLLVAHFASKYMVELAHARRGASGWELAALNTIRMATSVALGDLDHDGVDDIIVGRVYGDDLDSDGDAFLLRPDGARVPIPVVGGVRSLAIVDLDRDGHVELLIGDGWNRDYGHVARARLTHAWWNASAFETQLLDEGDGQYTLWDMLAVDVERGGDLEILTRGSAEVRMLTRHDGTWHSTRVASVCHDLLALELDASLAVWLACEDGGQVLRAQSW